MVEIVLVNGEEGVCFQGKNDQSIALGSPMACAEGRERVSAAGVESPC